jgi:GAF domain-containing protein
MMSQILKTETQKYALIGTSFGVLFPIIATIIRITGSNLPFDLSSAFLVQSIDPLLWIIDSAPFFLGLFAAAAGRRQDNQQKLYEELRLQGNELENARNTLEQRVRERTFELEKRAAQFQTISRVARTIAAVQDLGSLLSEITKLVSEQFGFYHTGIFLNDEANEYAVLEAANSEGGKRMLDRHHQLKLDATSMVGYATTRGEPRIALDVGTDAIYFNNPDLPETRSEMALPLRIGGRTIGALDVQSTKQNAFLEEDINVLLTLADQIAIAIENSRLFGESRSALSESQLTLDKYVKQVWGSFAQRARSTGFVFNGKEVVPLNRTSTREQFKATLQTGRLTIEKVASTVAVPIKLRGQTIGVLDVRSKGGQRDWTREEISMLEAAAERAALALENSRLVEGAQRRAARELAIGEISAKIGAANNLDSILQTAVEELGRKISGAAEVTLELSNSMHNQDTQ